MDLLMARVDPDTIRVVGRWRSDMILRYLHTTENSVPICSNMAPTRSFRQRTPETSAMRHSRYLKSPYKRGLWRPGTGLVWSRQHKYFLLAHSSLVSLVNRMPSMLAGIVLVKHFHLWVPKSRSIMSPEERTQAHEATLAHAAYLVVALKAQFF